MTNTMGTIHGVISGKVQGVWYRRFVEHEAGLYDIHGYAKNLDNGSVEIMLTGEAEQLHEMVKQLIVGPENSRVDKIEITPQRYTELEGFQIL
ncbi:acylphosphatase [Sinobacterium caligoides]|uniref:acylphosphatase n=1 Tax=Sinobacterium caligoides TaxID=933926 RepID=A0A3N2E0W1_9GAMM|nr:acylphosphatase [Sinobacterium caligoides]ROS05763.1 acylphosphatase [Sinobacterium caligoides]